MSARLYVTLQRAEVRLLSLGTVESLLVHVDMGTATDEEREYAAGAIEEAQRLDGSWQGSMLRTAEAMLLLRELRDGRRNNAVDRAIEWINDRTNCGGRFGDGCEDGMHALSLCHHAVSGFHAPAPRAVSLASLVLADGSSLGSDRDARIAVSALASAALFGFGEDSAQLRLQVDGLERIIEHTATGRFELSATALVCITRCLIAAPTGVGAAGRVSALNQLAHLQRADGSWPGLDLFLVLGVLAYATARGLAPLIVRSTLQNAAGMLFLMQQPDGGWGRDTGAWQLLAGWRCLRQLAGWRALQSSARAPVFNAFGSAAAPPNAE